MSLRHGGSPGVGVGVDDDGEREGKRRGKSQQLLTIHCVSGNASSLPSSYFPIYHQSICRNGSLIGQDNWEFDIELTWVPGTKAEEGVLVTEEALVPS